MQSMYDIFSGNNQENKKESNPRKSIDIPQTDKVTKID